MTDNVKKLVDCSRTYQRTGEALLERAHVLYFDDGTMDYSDYNLAIGLHANLMLAAQNLNNAATHLITAQLAGELPKILAATTELQNVSKKIEMVGNVISIVGKLVVAVAAIAASVTNPAGIPAAVSAVAVVVAEINKQAADKPPAKAG